NSPVTISRYVLGKKGTVSKDRKLLSKKGERLWSSKKPLIGHTQRLGHAISWQLLGSAGVMVGSPMVYAAVQQFGASKGAFGKNVPWGDIPARAFLGLSDADSAAIVKISVRFLASLRS
ncbi:MAG: phage virion morphogenesis protein, partial [Candidatus Methylumidiphilus sp.]